MSFTTTTRIAPAPRSYARRAYARVPGGATLLLVLLLMLVGLAALAALAMPDLGLAHG